MKTDELLSKMETLFHLNIEQLQKERHDLLKKALLRELGQLRDLIVREEYDKAMELFSRVAIEQFGEVFFLELGEIREAANFEQWSGHDRYDPVGVYAVLLLLSDLKFASDSEGGEE